MLDVVFNRPSANSRPRTLTRGLVVAALLMPAVTLACSCFDIQSIETAITDAPYVVIGRVEGVAPDEFHPDLDIPRSISIEIVDSLKGDLRGKIRIASIPLCYQSFPSWDLKPGSTFVFPLHPLDPFFLGATKQTAATHPDIQKIANQLYDLPRCSHTALALRGNKLYTNELGADGVHRLKYYARLSTFKLLMFTHLLNLPHLILWIVPAAVMGLFVLHTRRRIWK